MLRHRRQLFEIEDQPWIPTWFRGFMTDYLSALFSFFVPRTEVTDRLAAVLQQSGRGSVLDLCSGSSGPMLRVVDELEQRFGRQTRVTLSDLYPNVSAFQRLRRQSEGRVDFYPRPLDARRVEQAELIPEQRAAVRTIFAGFHHFSPDDARAILLNAVHHRSPVAIFEVSERRWATLLSLPWVALGVFLITPWLRPLSLRRWLFTYLIPLVPLAIFCDGVASCLRSYTVSELREMTSSLPSSGADGYRWQAGRAPVAGLPLLAVVWMTGVPINSTSIFQEPVDGTKPQNSS